jgi:hypothetical protein
MKANRLSNGFLRLHHKAERGRDGCRHELGVGQRSKIDEESRPVETIRHRMRNGDGDGGLSNSARTDDADEPTHHQLCRQAANCVVAAYHAGQLGWQHLEPIRDIVRSRR